MKPPTLHTHSVSGRIIYASALEVGDVRAQGDLFEDWSDWRPTALEGTPILQPKLITIIRPIPVEV